MAEFKCVVSDPKDAKSYQIAVKGHHANALVGKKIGDEVDGLFVNLPGYKVRIAGGSDKEGFPMRQDLPGLGRRKILVSKGFGYSPDRAGKRRRKSMRGNTITPDIVQVNLAVTKHGAKPIGEMIAEATKQA